jgi:hypothetical protein
MKRKVGFFEMLYDTYDPEHAQRRQYGRYTYDPVAFKIPALGRGKNKFEKKFKDKSSPDDHEQQAEGAFQATGQICYQQGSPYEAQYHHRYFQRPVQLDHDLPAVADVSFVVRY